MYEGEKDNPDTYNIDQHLYVHIVLCNNYVVNSLCIHSRHTYMYLHTYTCMYIYCVNVQVKRELDQLCGPDTLRPNVVVGVFLVREGASIHAVNRQGLHPLSARPPDVAQLVNSYATIHTKLVLNAHCCNLTEPLQYSLQ